MVLNNYFWTGNSFIREEKIWTLLYLLWFEFIWTTLTFLGIMSISPPPPTKSEDAHMPMLPTEL